MIATVATVANSCNDDDRTVSMDDSADDRFQGNRLRRIDSHLRSPLARDPFGRASEESMLSQTTSSVSSARFAPFLALTLEPLKPTAHRNY